MHSEAGQLNTIELVGACTLLLFGGHENTTNLIDNALAILLERPALADELRSHPERWETAIDEFMRAVGPARTMVRKVTSAHVRAGCELAARDTVFLSIAAANHDETVFAAPAEIDVARDPNPHLVSMGRLSGAHTGGWRRALRYRPARALPRMRAPSVLRYRSTMGFTRG